MIRSRLCACLVPLVSALVPHDGRAQRPTLGPATRAFVSVEAPAVAITNVVLIDGTGAAARRGQTVVMQDGTIRAVGATGSVAIPAGATVIDGTGHTLMPGIVGLHDHLYYTATGGRLVQLTFSGPRLYLASGVTTVRTTGSQSPYSDINLKRQVDAGQVPGPRIHVTSPYLTGPGGGGTMAIAKTAEDARRFVAYWAEEGATWIKFYTNISRAAMKAAIDEAHRRGMRATGHLCSVTFREAVEMGIDDLAHGAHTASDFYPGKKPDECPADNLAVLDREMRGDGPVATPLINYMVQRKASMTTTMAIYEVFYPGRPVTDARTLDLMAPDIRAAYLAERAMIDTAKAWPFTKGSFARALAFDRAFFKAGGLLSSGVDPTGNGGALPGLGDQRGYELLREAGFTTEEAVQVVTLNGARILGEETRLGSVEPGKVADLVLLAGDLTRDPGVIRRTVTVFKDGVGYDSAKLLAALKGRVGVN